MKKRTKLLWLIALVTVIGFFVVGCDDLFGTNNNGNSSGGNSGTGSSGGTSGTGGGSGGSSGNGDGGGTGSNDGTGSSGGSGGAGSTQEKAMSVTVGNSSSHTISSSGEHWFKFTGTGDPVIFETTGSVVDTYIAIFEGTSTLTFNTNDNGGEGSNALYGLTTKSGTTYWIKITARSSTSGTYTFVIKAPTSNLRANPITVSVGNSSSHTIFSSGTHWFMFTGTGDRVFFETDDNVVDTNMRIYIGDSTSQSYSKSSSNKGINFFTTVGTTYYINITGNSGTYTFIVRNGTGDGSSQYNAIEVANSYSSSHTITSSGVHWFIYKGTGNSTTFKTTGNIVDTYIAIFEGTSTLTFNTNDNGGEGSNALYSLITKSGTTYWIKIEARSSTSGTYTFVVE